MPFAAARMAPATAARAVEPSLTPTPARTVPPRPSLPVDPAPDSPSRPTRSLTLPDLVVMSMLLERPMHGYELNQELVRRDVQDWAGVSRPQVYYSLRKLEDAGFVEPSSGVPQAHERESTRDRRTLEVTASGRRAFDAALAREDWTAHRPPPPFLTWLVLAVHAPRDVVRRQIERRRRFLEREIRVERDTLQDIRADYGPMIPTAELIVELTIRQFELELAWLGEAEERLLGAGR